MPQLCPVVGGGGSGRWSGGDRCQTERATESEGRRDLVHGSRQGRSPSW